MARSFAKQLRRQLDLVRVHFWHNLSRWSVKFLVCPRYDVALTEDSDRMPKGAFVLVANHASFLDPWFVGNYIRTPGSYMCNDDAFRGSKLRAWYLNNVGAYPKRKGATDVRALKETLRRLRAGLSVCIFPEGQTTWDGQTQPLIPGTEKIIRKIKCPLVIAKIKGHFLSKPWWATHRRYGRVRIRFQVISPETIANMGATELLDFICAELQHNDIEDPDNAKVPFRGEQLAEGLEFFVWRCLACEADDQLSTRGNEITCDKCHATFNIDAHCRLHGPADAASRVPNLYAWARWQADVVQKDLASASSAENSTITSSTNVALSTLDKQTDEYVDRGRGVLTLRANELEFRPGDAAAELKFPIAQVKDFVVQDRDIFECTIDGVSHRFKFEARSPMKWIYYFRYLNGFAKYEAQGYF